MFFRLAFYEFINNEDIRRLFVFNRPPKQIIASLIPPHDLKYKSIFFLKCNAGTKLTKENIGIMPVFAVYYKTPFILEDYIFM